MKYKTAMSLAFVDRNQRDIKFIFSVSLGVLVRTG